MSSFSNLLESRIEESQSHLCVGLDISPEGLGDANLPLDACISHTKRVIDATRDLVVAYKPNLAFFERWGSAGFRWLEETLSYIGTEVLVIGDAKRGDIGNSAQQYARSLFEHFNFDAVTLSPYMGCDTIEPFVTYRDKGIFLLCRTSNPGAGEIQDLKSDGKPLYEVVVQMGVKLSQKNNNVGLVVGATAPDELKRIRELAPGLPLLIPGIGTQGGDLKAAFHYGNRDGIAIINASRSIVYAGDLSKKDIRSAAEDLLKPMQSFWLNPA